MSFQDLDLGHKILRLTGRTTLQKICLFEDRFAVAHHGRNQINKQSI